MESVSVERLDHLGIVASVIKDLGEFRKRFSCVRLVSQKFQKAGTRILSNPTGKGKRSMQRVNSTPKQPRSQWTGCCLIQLFRPQETGPEFLALSHWA